MVECWGDDAGKTLKDAKEVKFDRSRKLKQEENNKHLWDNWENKMSTM